MSKLSSFLQNNTSNHLVLNLLNKSLYNKVLFIEETGLNQDTFKIVDNNDFFNFLICKKEYIKKFGFSLNTKSFFFINTSNNTIKFSVKTSFLSFIYCKFIKSLHKVIFCLNKLKTYYSAKIIGKYNSLILLNTIRSGFKVSYCGVIGFLPSSKIISLLLNIINQLFCKSFFFVFFVKQFYSKILIRLKFSTVKIAFLPLDLERRNFNKKNLRFAVGLNFYFLNLKVKI